MTDIILRPGTSIVIGDIRIFAGHPDQKEVGGHAQPHTALVMRKAAALLEMFGRSTSRECRAITIHEAICEAAKNAGVNGFVTFDLELTRQQFIDKWLPEQP